MILQTRGTAAIYELESLARMLFPGAERTDAPRIPGGDSILAECERGGEKTLLRVTLTLGGQVRVRECPADPALSDKQYAFEMCRLLYSLFREATGRELRWGMLTGIRPIKLFHNLAAQGLSDSEIAERIQSRYLIGDEMTALALDIRAREAKINSRSLPRGFSLYLSVPFCPQRCSYCSFVSSSVERMRPLIPRYVELLCREIEETARVARSLGLQLQTVYMGGGTPTTLSAPELRQVLGTVRRVFDCTDVLEFTVEAGRPDTIDAERLSVLHALGVGRISINPQSMNDRTLRAVGRGHTAEDIVRAYALARDIGFSCINMDLIAGLSDETPDEFAASLSQVMALRPENITVHSLTLKRASTLVEQGQAELFYRRSAETAQMVDAARRALMSGGWQPYYLYRQKNTIGALDNTGYALPGTEGCYNVLIMDETQTILACGAGAVTKLRRPGGEKIERIYNYKYPAEYIAGFDEMLRRKEKIADFYNCLAPA